jgi:hypothetical protein
MFVMDFQQNKPAVNAAGLFSLSLKNGKHSFGVTFPSNPLIDNTF